MPNQQMPLIEVVNPGNSLPRQQTALVTTSKFPEIGNAKSLAMRRIAFLFLLFPVAVTAQEDCELFNLQDLAAENLELHDSIAQLHDSIAQFSVDTVILQPDGSFAVQLSNGSTFSQIQGCTDPAFLEYDPLANTDDGSCTSICADVAMDGYTYSTVRIGNQCWFAENLSTSEYRNGHLIPTNLTDGEWSSTSAGAFSFGAYGKLYNWHAIDDSRGICPIGWHVPSKQEWTDLVDFVASEGFVGTEGTALKSTSGWANNGNGTDDFGFSAPPGGSRNGANGSGCCFNPIHGIWWSASLNSDGNHAWAAKIRHSATDIGVWEYIQNTGMSVRCLKD